jgi:hypothetical protein
MLVVVKIPVQKHLNSINVIHNRRTVHDTQYLRVRVVSVVTSVYYGLTRANTIGECVMGKGNVCPQKIKHGTLFQRVMARINGMAALGTRRFLGYCTFHHRYFVDWLHSKQEIRCPVCDREWLMKRTPAR